MHEVRAPRFAVSTETGGGPRPPLTFRVCAPTHRVALCAARMRLLPGTGLFSRVAGAPAPHGARACPATAREGRQAARHPGSQTDRQLRNQEASKAGGLPGTTRRSRQAARQAS